MRFVRQLNPNPNYRRFQWCWLDSWLTTALTVNMLNYVAAIYMYILKVSHEEIASSRSSKFPKHGLGTEALFLLNAPYT